MPDQLSLEFPDQLPPLPTGLRPMEPRPLAVPFDSADHVFQPLWGGLRVLVFVARPADGSSSLSPLLRLVDGEGIDRTDRFPDLAALPEYLDARSAVLDGELVVVDQFGRLDEGALADRLASATHRPALVLAFDLLHLDGRSLLGMPLHRRRDLLRRVILPGGTLLVLPGIEGDGCALHAAVSAQGLAGVLARVRSSPYLPGVRSRFWRFVPAGRAPIEQAEARAAAEEPVDERVIGPGGGDAAPEDRRRAGPILAVISRLPLEEP